MFQGLDVKGGFFYEFMTQTQLSSHDHTKRANIELVPLTLKLERDSHKRVNLKVIFFSLWSNVRPLPTFLRYPNFL